jgi:PncC family amidohydrolase
LADRTRQEAQDDLLSPSAPTALDALAEQLQAKAVLHGLSVATAESCTGGLIGHIITEVPGSSAYFRGGIISYDNGLKVDALGVPEASIERHGAVSAQVAKAMADGARERLDADVAVAVTGVAGPGGGTSQKPVGLTYVAVSGPAGDIVQRRVWSGDRSENKQDSARLALELLIESVTAAADRSAT